VDPEDGDLVVRAAHGLDEAALTRRIPYRAGVAGAALRAGQALLVDNIETDRRFSKKSHPQYFTKSLLAAPIVVAGESVGVLNVNNKESHEDFVEADRALLATLVSRLDGALTRAYAYPGAPSIVTEARQAMRAASHAQGEFMLDHPTLAAHARATGERLGLDPLDAGRVAGLAGDDADPASPDELEARRVLLSARGERFDGTGGPLGLAGEAIPPGARLLAVLDRFARLVRGRAYRPGLTPLEALAVLRNARGQTLDPRVVDAWCEVVEQDLARHNAAPSARPKEAA
jgi:hypothetical protein